MAEKLPTSDRIAVRLNSVNTDHFVDDIRCVVSITKCLARTVPPYMNIETDVSTP